MEAGRALRLGDSKKVQQENCLGELEKRGAIYVLVENRERVACDNVEGKVVNERVDLAEAISGKNVEGYSFRWPKQVRRLGFKDGRMHPFPRKK